jgi:hypothetical protein
MISNSSRPLSFSPSESLASTAAGGSLGRLPWRRLATLEDAITTEKSTKQTKPRKTVIAVGLIYVQLV